MNSMNENIKARYIAVQFTRSGNGQNVSKLLAKLAEFGFGPDCVTLFNGTGESVQDVNAEIVTIPPEYNAMSKAKNFIMNSMAVKGGFRFLHLIEDDVEILKDPAPYIAELENTMDSLGYSIHFSTVTDRCNYVFNKFCPRLTIDIDDIGVKESMRLPASVSFTSHSNTAWTTYDCSRFENGVPPLFNDKFSIAMFVIIEYLARRRATKEPGQLYYMNQYLSLPSEIGTFRLYGGKADEIDQKKMQEEDQAFKALAIDFSPDNSIDKILEDFYAIVKK